MRSVRADEPVELPALPALHDFINDAVRLYMRELAKRARTVRHAASLAGVNRTHFYDVLERFGAADDFRSARPSPAADMPPVLRANLLSLLAKPRGPSAPNPRQPRFHGLRRRRSA